MRFMVITKATADSEAGRPASTEEIATMGGFLQELTDAGVLLAAEGIHLSAKGARIYFDGEKKTVVDGPFAETKELVGGFFLVETKTLEECVEWFKRCPIQPPGAAPTNIEIRRSAGPTGRPAGPAQLPPAVQRARRPAGQAGPARRGAGGVRAGGVADPQRAGADPAAGPRGRLRPARLRVRARWSGGTGRR
ncbi:YciI family protein [Actinoplanes subtropicus]|uniref:YciI family protein n=1 Tax=Actinoplanes subtropicus TaxID=543632 RepID=UPI000A054A88|nr:YciI family protein [Actinoplanes subtropicus]